MYSVEKSPYLRVDLLWNNKNLWVNMQLVPVEELNLDLYDSRCYEYVLLNQGTTKNIGETAEA